VRLESCPQEINILKTFNVPLFHRGDKNLAGFNSDFRFSGQKHICAALKDKSAAQIQTLKPNN